MLPAVQLYNEITQADLDQQISLEYPDIQFDAELFHNLEQQQQPQQRQNQKIELHFGEDQRTIFNILDSNMLDSPSFSSWPQEAINVKQYHQDHYRPPSTTMSQIVGGIDFKSENQLPPLLQSPPPVQQPPPQTPTPPPSPPPPQQQQPPPHTQLPTAFDALMNTFNDFKNQFTLVNTVQEQLNAIQTNINAVQQIFANNENFIKQFIENGEALLRKLQDDISTQCNNHSKQPQPPPPPLTRLRKRPAPRKEQITVVDDDSNSGDDDYDDDTIFDGGDEIDEDAAPPNKIPNTTNIIITSNVVQAKADYDAAIRGGFDMSRLFGTVKFSNTDITCLNASLKEFEKVVHSNHAFHRNDITVDIIGQLSKYFKEQRPTAKNCDNICWKFQFKPCHIHTIFFRRGRVYRKLFSERDVAKISYNDISFSELAILIEKLDTFHGTFIPFMFKCKSTYINTRMICIKYYDIVYWVFCCRQNELPQAHFLLTDLIYNVRRNLHHIIFTTNVFFPNLPKPKSLDYSIKAFNAIAISLFMYFKCVFNIDDFMAVLLNRLDGAKKFSELDILHHITHIQPKKNDGPAQVNYYYNPSTAKCEIRNIDTFTSDLKNACVIKESYAHTTSPISEFRNVLNDIKFPVLEYATPTIKNPPLKLNIKRRRMTVVS